MKIPTFVFLQARSVPKDNPTFLHELLPARFRLYNIFIFKRLNDPGRYSKVKNYMAIQAIQDYQKTIKSKIF